MDKYTLNKKLRFIKEYTKATNAATGSWYDSNANVTQKNIATLQHELSKKDIIDVNRAITSNYIEKAYGKELVNQYYKDIKSHIIYRHDETSLFPYCCSVSLYPYIMDGLQDLGGSSTVPKHADSFIGGMINLIPLISAQFAGAVAIPEFFTYFDYFLRKTYSQDYTDHLDEYVESFGNRKRTLRKRIEDWFQQFVYSINQPAGAKNYQSPFTNVAYFDKYYFENIFKDFYFPDGDKPNWETTKELQKLFMKWFNKERTKAILTFPVESFNILVENGKYKDEETADFIAEMWAEGHSFFLYQSDSVDALASCCRLRNAIAENDFSYTLGAGGVKTGSKCVITLNLNRIVQDWVKEQNKNLVPGDEVTLKGYITPIISRIHKYLKAWNNKLYNDYNNNLLTIYKAGFIDLKDQFLTLGINGFLEGAEFLKQWNDKNEIKYYPGIEAKSDNEIYKKYAKDILNTMRKMNKRAKTDKIKFNSEFVPAENLAVKNYNWDKKDGYWVPKDRNMYNSYFYPVEDTTINPIEKFYYQGTGFADVCDGGVALHNNLSEHLTKTQYRYLMDVAVKAGCNYFTFNIPNTLCRDCGFISKHKLDKCPKCGSENLDYATRIIGYLKLISNFSEPRQEEASHRFYAEPEMVGE